MKLIIYRRDNISLALRHNGITTGVNLYIWYGYASSESKRDDLIVDAALIKEDMRVDLRDFDHVCIDINRAYDIVDSMIEIGQKIFTQAMARTSLYEIILEDIYGDEVVIRDGYATVHKRFLYNSRDEGTVFSCNDSKRQRLFGIPFREFTFTSNENITEESLNHIMMNANNNMQYQISSTDEASAIISTFNGQESIPQYITFCITEHIAHQLPDLSVLGKCSRLHGHTYRCYVAVNNAHKLPVTSELVSTIGESVRTHIRKAFEDGNLSVTSTENIIRYLSEKLCDDYDVAFIELSETPNIKARLFIGNGICGETI